MIAIAKAASNKTRILFTNELDLNLGKKLIKCDIWSMLVYGAETCDNSEYRSEIPGKF
jgi:hypothetical protein